MKAFWWQGGLHIQPENDVEPEALMVLVRSFHLSCRQRMTARRRQMRRYQEVAMEGPTLASRQTAEELQAQTLVRLARETAVRQARSIYPCLMPTVIAYVTEEVRRQGHDVTTLDGIQRVAWMLNAWAIAIVDADGSSNRPGLFAAVGIGKYIEPVKNEHGLRRVGVRVGSRRCPPPERVPELLELLFQQRDALSPLEFYKRFEEIHPFVDGNGRTGKILLNWLNGTLLDPVFPPADLFGYPIQNP